MESVRLRNFPWYRSTLRLLPMMVLLSAAGLVGLADLHAESAASPAPAATPGAITSHAGKPGDSATTPTAPASPESGARHTGAGSSSGTADAHKGATQKDVAGKSAAKPGAASKKKGRGRDKKTALVAPLVELPAPAPVNADDVLDITLLEPSTGPLQQGALVPFRFLIKNTTPDVIILKEIVPESLEDPPLPFVLSGYGTVRYDDQHDAYVYDPLVQQATPKLFNHGVMLPGEARRVELVLRQLQERQQISFRFQRMPVDSFRRIGFAAIEGGAGQKVTFQHLQSLSPEFLKAKSIPDGPILERPYILWEQLLPQPLTLLEQNYVRRIPLKMLPLTGKEALQSAGLEGTPTWWDWAGGWVVIGQRGSVLVTASGKRPLPKVDSRLFRDIDSGKTRVRVKLTASAEVFKGRFVTRDGDGVYTFGDFIEVPRDRLWEFLDLARGENLEITRETYLFDAYYYLLTPLP